MHIENLKRWHCACIGLVLGLTFSFWCGWVGPEGTLIDRPTLESSEFEKLLVKKAPSGRPVVKDVLVYHMDEGTGWLVAQQLMHRGADPKVPAEYVLVKIPVKTPYIPTINPPAKVDPKYTVVDYLKSVSAMNPEVQFSTRWWARDPVQTPMFALLGTMLLGGAGPSLIQALAGAGGRGGKAENAKLRYGLSLLGKHRPELPMAGRSQPSRWQAIEVNASPGGEQCFHGEFYPTFSRGLPEPKRPKQTKLEANVKAREHLKNNPKATARELASAIGCALGMVSSLPAWRAVQEQRAKGRQPKKTGVVSLTPKLERVAGTEDDPLTKLIAEQQADTEPSPLEADPPPRDHGAPRKAKVYRQP